MAKRVKKVKTLADIIAAEVKAERLARAEDEGEILDTIQDNLNYSYDFNKTLRSMIKAAL